MIDFVDDKIIVLFNNLHVIKHRVLQEFISLYYSGRGDLSCMSLVWSLSK